MPIHKYKYFAPTDAAFLALLEELGMTAEQLLSDQALVTRVLRYHIVRGNLDSTEVLSKERIRTLTRVLCARARGATRGA